MWPPQPPSRTRRTSFQLAAGYADHIKQEQNAVSMNIERGIDEVVMASLRASLSSLGKVFKAGLVDEDMPPSWQRHVARFNDTLWINFKEYVEEEVYEQRSLERKDHRRSLIASWATDRRCWQRGSGRLPDPFGWLRARILYSLCPADATMWQVGATTSFWVVLVLTVLPFYGISIYTCGRPFPPAPPHVLTSRATAVAGGQAEPSHSFGPRGLRPRRRYVGLFLIIERTDEYQLVSFICRFKALQFLIQGVRRRRTRADLARRTARAGQALSPGPSAAHAHVHCRMSASPPAPFPALPTLPVRRFPPFRLRYGTTRAST